MTTRRTFLKIGTTLAASGLVVPLFSEPMAIVKDAGDWVEDKGDYCIIRIPEGKVFAGESIRKNAIIIAGAFSAIRDCDFDGYVNITTRGDFNFSKSCVDSSKASAKIPRALVFLESNEKHRVFFSDSYFRCNPQDASWLEVKNSFAPLQNRK